MSYPTDKTGTWGSSLLLGAIATGIAIAGSFILFLYYEAIRMLLTYGWSDFNVLVLGGTLLWILVSAGVHVIRKDT